MNIYDVAKDAGVSTATVSRVINGSGKVNESTKQKVLDSIKKLGYKPNAVARSLATKSTNIIGVMVSDVRDPFHAEASFLLEQLLYKEGYSTILCNTTESKIQQYEYFDLLYSEQVDGIIAVGSMFNDDRLINQIKYINQKIPVILLNNEADEIISVHLNVDTGIRQSLEYLKESGKKSPIYIKHQMEYETLASQNKERAFTSQVEEIFGIKPYIYKIDDGEDKNRELIDYIKCNPHIDSLLFEKDLLAIRFMKYAMESGISIPDELALVGFDNLRLTDMTYKSVSTIDHKIQEMCEIAVKLLTSKLEDDKDIAYSNVVNSNFIPKETT